MTAPIVEKAFAYITHRGALLVFRHPNSPEASIQVPAGTIEPGEKPRAAVLREAEEETGLTGLEVSAALGTVDFDFSAFSRSGRDEIHRRHFFHLTAGGEPPDTWRHAERHRSDGGAPIPFDFFWARLPDDVPPLIADHDALLPRLVDLLSLDA